MPSNALSTKSRLQSTEFKQESVGHVLNKRRIEQGIAIEDIAKATKIRLYFLRLLEKDDFKSLPDTVYTTGFIRSYCEYLKIPAEPLISNYITSSTKNEIDIPFKIHIPQSSEKIMSPRIIFISISILISASILWYTFKNPSLHTKANNVIPSSQLNDINATHDKIALSNKDEKQINTVNPITNELSVSENNVSSIETKNAPDSQKDLVVSSVPDSSDFTIEALEETWIKITNEQGVRLTVSFLKKGDKIPLNAYENNFISVGNAESVAFVRGNTKIEGSIYLDTPAGFAESKKIIVPPAPFVVE
ncbi:MAG: RodZ domain-containing protein [Pseudomonadota bacterium]